VYGPGSWSAGYAVQDGYRAAAGSFAPNASSQPAAAVRPAVAKSTEEAAEVGTDLRASDRAALAARSIAVEAAAARSAAAAARWSTAADSVEARSAEAAAARSAAAPTTSRWSFGGSSSTAAEQEKEAATARPVPEFNTPGGAARAARPTTAAAAATTTAAAADSVKAATLAPESRNARVAELINGYEARHADGSLKSAPPKQMVVGPGDIVRHITQRSSSPRVLRYAASYDVARSIWRALGDGGDDARRADD